jgi:hypothetical protein
MLKRAGGVARHLDEAEAGTEAAGRRGRAAAVLVEQFERGAVERAEFVEFGSERLSGGGRHVVTGGDPVAGVSLKHEHEADAAFLAGLA